MAIRGMAVSHIGTAVWCGAYASLVFPYLVSGEDGFGFIALYPSSPDPLCLQKMQKDTFNYSPQYMMNMMNVFMVLLSGIVFLAVLKSHINYFYLASGMVLLYAVLFVRTRFLVRKMNR